MFFLYNRKLTMCLVIVLAMLLLPANIALADTTGQRSASTVTGWTNPQNSTASDNIYTTALLYTGQDPGALASTNFGFSIPSDATINGIEVKVERKQQSLGSNGSFTDSMACLVINGSPNFNANRAVIWTAWSTAEEIKTFGSATDLWGLTLTPALINNTGFGFYLRPIKAIGKAVASVDYISMTVYYTLAPDTTPPVIAAQSDITAEATSASGAIVTFTPTATDNVDPSVTVVCTPASGSQFPLGTTSVTCNATDAAGNAALPVTFNVTVQDTTAPVITLTGINPLNIDQDTTYNEPGANWTDAVDGTGAAIVGGDTVDTSKPGTSYTVTYNYTDNAGNAAAQVTRTVNVLDTVLPVIDPQNDMTVEATSASGAVVTFTPTATDNVDATVTVVCTPASGSQFPLGTTQVTCNATDTAGNAALPVTFNVTVQDTMAPVITLIGSNPYLVNYASSYAEPGATWTDAVDGSGPALVGGQTVDTLIPGDYLITYNKTDAAGNAAVQVTRIVTVRPWSTIHVSAIVQNWKGVDTIDPHQFTILLNGASGQTISQTLSATFDRLAPGTYTITVVADNKYTVNTITGDNDGNPQNGVTLTVGSGETNNLTFTIWKLKDKIK